MQPDVVVIGAGVIGLQISVALLEAGYRVGIVAKHFPGDRSIEYTSPWAGAHWRPHGTADDEEQCKWDMQTYRQWMNTYKQGAADGLEDNERSGIASVNSRLMWDSGHHAELGSTQTPRSLWFAKKVHDFSLIPNSQGPIDSASFTSLAIDVPHFLEYLMRRIQSLGGLMRRAALPTSGGVELASQSASQTLEDAGFWQRRSSSNAAYVNATGLGARELCDDETMYPARGQTLLVRGEAKGCSTRQGKDYIAYCIPRSGSGTTVLGGTKGIGVWSGKEDKNVTKVILERARELCPELLRSNDEEGRGDFEVLSVNVGLRPMREGGARMEREVLPSGRVVYHAYGHGGAGFQNSVGVAAKILQMIRDSADGIGSSSSGKL